MPLVFSILKAKVGMAVPAANIYARYEPVVNCTTGSAGLSNLVADSILYQSASPDWTMPWSVSIVKEKSSDPLFILKTEGCEISRLQFQVLELGVPVGRTHEPVIIQAETSTNLREDLTNGVGNTGSNCAIPYLMVSNQAQSFPHLESGFTSSEKQGMNNLYLWETNRGEEHQRFKQGLAIITEPTSNITFTGFTKQGAEVGVLWYGSTDHVVNASPWPSQGTKVTAITFNPRFSENRAEQQDSISPVTFAYQAREAEEPHTQSHTDTIKEIGLMRIVTFLEGKFFAENGDGTSYGISLYLGEVGVQPYCNLVDISSLSLTLGHQNETVSTKTISCYAQPCTSLKNEASSPNIGTPKSDCEKQLGITGIPYTVIKQEANSTNLIKSISSIQNKSYAFWYPHTIIEKAAGYTVSKTGVEIASRKEFAHRYVHTQLLNSSQSISSIGGQGVGQQAGLNFIPYVYLERLGETVALAPPGRGDLTKVPHQLSQTCLSNMAITCKQVIPSSTGQFLAVPTIFDLSKISGAATGYSSNKEGQAKSPVVLVHPSVHTKLTNRASSVSLIQHQAIIDALLYPVPQCFMSLVVQGTNKGEIKKFVDVSGSVQKQTVERQPLVIQTASAGYEFGVSLSVGSIVQGTTPLPYNVLSHSGQGYGGPDDSAWLDPNRNTQYEEEVETVENLIVELGDCVVVNHQLRVGI